MNVFVLCAGRCGSVTLSKACQHITNFTCSHESMSGLHADKRFSFPGNHIEVDNRFAWMLGRLDTAYGDSALYVYLSRNANAIANSYNRRWDTDVSIIKAYTHGVLMRDSESLDDCIDYVQTVDANIRHFLKDKTGVVEIRLEHFEEDFKSFWKAIGAKGDLDAALSATGVSHNASELTPSKVKLPVGGNHSFSSRKQLSMLNKIERSIDVIGEKEKVLADKLDLLINTGEERELAVQTLRAQIKAKDARTKIREAELKKTISRERAKLQKLRQSLAYQVANSLAQGLGMGRAKYLKLALSPLYVARGMRRYVHSKRQTLKVQAEQKACQAQVTSKPAVKRVPKAEWPVPLRSNLAWSAMQLMEEFGVDEALEFLDCYCGKDNSFLKDIFSANKDVANRNADAWLEKVNKYLARYSLSPISLSGEADIADEKLGFVRISTGAPVGPVVEEGPKISVIMPAFNAESTIEHSMSSILNQTWQNLELIVVDDCSEDGTWSIIQGIAKADSRVVALKNAENVGPYVSKNLALNCVTGDFLTGHDADDWAHPQRLEIQVQSMLDAPDIKVTIGRMIRMAPDRSMNFFTKIGRISHDGVARLAYISCMFRTEEFRENLGHWDSVRFGGDSELIERAKIVFKEGFVTLNTITMLCLDAEGSLTNHSEHGISKVNGVSDTRARYRDGWSKWHRETMHGNTRLAFPHSPRKFPVPDVAQVSNAAIARNLNQMASVDDSKKRQTVLFVLLEGLMGKLLKSSDSTEFGEEFFSSDMWKDRPNSTSRLNLVNYSAVCRLRDKYDIRFMHVTEMNDDIRKGLKTSDIVVVNQVASPNSIALLQEFLDEVRYETPRARVIFGTELSIHNEMKKGNLSLRELNELYFDHLLLRHTGKTDRELYLRDDCVSANIQEFEIGIDTDVVAYGKPISERKYITFVKAPEGRATKNNQGVDEIIAALKQDAAFSKYEIKVMIPPYGSLEYWKVMAETAFFLFTSKGETFSYCLNDAKASGAITFYPEQMYFMNVGFNFIVESYPWSGLKYSTVSNLLKKMRKLVSNKSLLETESLRSRQVVVDHFSIEAISNNWDKLLEGSSLNRETLFVYDAGNSELSWSDVVERCKRSGAKYAMPYLNRDVSGMTLAATALDQENDIVKVGYYLVEDAHTGELHRTRCLNKHEGKLYFGVGESAEEVEAETVAFLQLVTRVNKVGRIVLDESVNSESLKNAASKVQSFFGFKCGRAGVEVSMAEKEASLA